MTGLRDHVAQAIMKDTTCGGPNLLGADEQDALMRGARMLEDAGQQGSADLLRVLAIELGANHLPFLQAEKPRVDAYYRYCADVAIAAYDQWLAGALARRRLAEAVR
jgi:hypothetical protein